MVVVPTPRIVLMDLAIRCLLMQKIGSLSICIAVGVVSLSLGHCGKAGLPPIRKQKYLWGPKKSKLSFFAEISLLRVQVNSRIKLRVGVGVGRKVHTVPICAVQRSE